MLHILRNAAFAAALLGVAVGASPAEEIEVRYRFGLSDLSGPVRILGGKVRVDAANREVLLVDGNTVHVFNAAGMETFAFSLDPSQGQVFDVAVDESGDFLLACSNPRPEPGAPRFLIARCDYRGTAKGAVLPQLPEALAGFSPSSMLLRESGSLYFLSPVELKLVVLGTDGRLLREMDLAAALEIEPEERGNLEIGGFGFDAAGNLVFTIPEHYRTVVVGSDGTKRGGFGRKGSGPGRFAVAAGVAGDDRGNLYVADKGRSVVLVFDREMKFVTEFGNYGDQPENLVRPDQVAWLPGGTLLVTQMRNRGVSVFDVAAR